MRYPTAVPALKAIPGPTITEMEEGLKQWAEARPHTMRVETVGHSPEGLPILLCRITDDAVSDDDKQVALFTTTHSGIERTTVGGILRLIKWLVSDDSLAVEIRRKQIVLIMPSCEPESYDRKATDVGEFFANRSRLVYEGWTWHGPENPESQPEAMAIKRVVDQYQPEAYQDVHGIWFDRSTMWESTGVSWGSNIYRSYAPQVARLMNDAAEEAGFLIGGAEEASGQILSTVPVPGAERWFYGFSSKPRVVAGLYPYYQYHTLVQTMEVGWEESAVVRLRRLLQVGNETWRGEPQPGYPVNQISCWGSSAIAAWGTNASERRKSRIELWRKLPQISHLCGWPEPRNSIVILVATLPEARARYTPGEGSKAPGIGKPNIGPVFESIKENPRFNGGALDAFRRETTAQYLEWAYPAYDGPSSPIEHGLAIRLLLPYPSVKFSHLKLDGHDIAPSESDGYIEYHNPGTIVQINIPPGKVQDFHVITGLFDSDAKRVNGFHAEDWQL